MHQTVGAMILCRHGGARVASRPIDSICLLTMSSLATSTVAVRTNDK